MLRCYGIHRYINSIVRRVHKAVTKSSGVPGGVQTPPPRNSEVLTKLSRIPSFVENTSVTTLDIPKVWQSRTGLQIERNPGLGATAPRSPVSLPSVQNWIFWPPPPPQQNSWVRHWRNATIRFCHYSPPVCHFARTNSTSSEWIFDTFKFWF
jgi:hypothetical protein